MTENSNTLWSAADRGDTETVRQLLAAGRDVNARNCLGCTPLLYACGSGHLETVSLGLKTVKDLKGRFPGPSAAGTS